MRDIQSPVAIIADIEMGLRPISNLDTHLRRGRSEGEIAIHPRSLLITLFCNWIVTRFSNMHPVADDGDRDAVIVTIDETEGQHERIVVFSK